MKGGNEKNNKRKDYFLTTEKILDSQLVKKENKILKNKCDCYQPHDYYITISNFPKKLLIYKHKQNHQMNKYVALNHF